VALTSAWIMAIMVMCGIPCLINKAYARIGTKVGFIFSGLTTSMFTATVLFLLETNDLSHKEIDEMFIDVSPASQGSFLRAVFTNLPSASSVDQYKQYICTGNVAEYNVSESKIEIIHHKGKAVV
jgi:hypothetical protein